MILVDTSVWIDFFKPLNGRAGNFLAGQIERGAPLAINAIIEMEILQGIREEATHSTVKNFLKEFQYFPDFTKRYFDTAEDIYRGCRKRGITVRRSLDCLIASNCLIDELEILHVDRDFDSIGIAFPGLRVVEIT